jgi:hypothetical protein
MYYLPFKMKLSFLHMGSVPERVCISLEKEKNRPFERGCRHVVVKRQEEPAAERLLLAERGFGSWTRRILQAFRHTHALQVYPLQPHPTISPEPHRIHIHFQLADNVRIGMTFGRCKDDPCSQHRRLRIVAAAILVVNATGSTLSR